MIKRYLFLEIYRPLLHVLEIVYEQILQLVMRRPCMTNMREEIIMEGKIESWMMIMERNEETKGNGDREGMEF